MTSTHAWSINCGTRYRKKSISRHVMLEPMIIQAYGLCGLIILPYFINGDSCSLFEEGWIHSVQKKEHASNIEGVFSLNFFFGRQLSI